MSARRPDFLVIGAQRAATTWLANTMRSHAELWLPPRKELHYFDRDPRYPSPSHLARERSVGVAMKELLDRSRQHGGIRTDLVRALRRRDLAGVRWVLRYYGRQPDDHWYADLFSDAGDRIAGELTPSYSILESADVRKVHAAVPDARIVFVLREPIGRAWSQLRLVGDRRGRLLTNAEILDFVVQPMQLARSDYATTIDRWRDVFGDSQVWIGAYDEIKADPSQFLVRLAQHLDVDPFGFDAAARINRATAVTIPPDVERRLAEVFEPLLHRTSDRVGHEHVASIVDGWLRRYQEILGG